MAPLVYRNAVVLLNGTELTGAINDLAIEYGVEVLDRTVMGNDTRVRAGGLKHAKASGKGWFDGAVGVEAILWPDVGVDDVIFTIFPDGVTEGSQTTGIGYAMKAVLSTFTLGGTVGALLPVTFAAESRGALAPGVTSTP